MRRLYHSTTSDCADAIQRDGFRDAIGAYLTNRNWTGVCVSTKPLDENEGAKGHVVLTVSLEKSPSELARYEWAEDPPSGRDPREFLLPAKILNRRRKIVRRFDSWGGGDPLLTVPL